MFENCRLRNIWKLFQLWYLRISSSVVHLPEQIGELQYLETLDLHCTCIRELPASIIKLRRLKWLFADGVKLPDGVGNMQALEELSGVHVYDDYSINSLQELGSLTKLRTFWLVWCISDSHNDKMACAGILASSLGKLCSSKLRCLHVARGVDTADIPLDSWSPPPHLLRELDIQDSPGDSRVYGLTFQPHGAMHQG